MSEYQFYEFQSLDRALTGDESDQIATLSRRVDLSTHRAVFTYSYADFPSDPVDLLGQCFDALLYLANWGSRQLYFRMPKVNLRESTLAAYCVEEVIFTRQCGDYLLLGICLDEEEGSGWIDGEGLLSPLTPLRGQILEGDHRVLYLAWLKAMENAGDDVAKDALEPPVPAGLRQMDTSLSSFVEMFEIDEDLIAVAAETSPEVPKEPEPHLEQWLPKLSASERHAYLQDLVRGDSNVGMRLRQRLKELARKQQPAAFHSKVPPRRSWAQLVAGAETLRRQQAERAHQEAQAARTRKLAGLASREPHMWKDVIALIARKQTKAYDQAVEILTDLRDLAVFEQRADRFADRISEIQKTTRTLPGLQSRLCAANLLAKLS